MKKKKKSPTARIPKLREKKSKSKNVVLPVAGDSPVGSRSDEEMTIALVSIISQFPDGLRTPSIATKRALLLLKECIPIARRGGFPLPEFAGSAACVLHDDEFSAAAIRAKKVWDACRSEVFRAKLDGGIKSLNQTRPFIEVIREVTQTGKKRRGEREERALPKYRIFLYHQFLSESRDWEDPTPQELLLEWKDIPEEDELRVQAEKMLAEQSKNGLSKVEEVVLKEVFPRFWRLRKSAKAKQSAGENLNAFGKGPES